MAEVHPSVIMEGNITIGAFTRINAGCILKGDIVIGHHCRIACNVVIRGRNRIGNFTHIYDNVCIEGGRPGGVNGVLGDQPDQSLIGNECWINHGATMHGSQLGDRSCIGLNACLDYNTRVGKGSIVSNGSSTQVNQAIPNNTLVDGVPATIIKTNITTEDRAKYFGLDPVKWVHYQGSKFEEEIRKKKGQMYK